MRLNCTTLAIYINILYCLVLTSYHLYYFSSESNNILPEIRITIGVFLLVSNSILLIRSDLDMQIVSTPLILSNSLVPYLNQDLFNYQLNEGSIYFIQQKLALALLVLVLTYLLANLSFSRKRFNIIGKGDSLLLFMSCSWLGPIDFLTSIAVSSTLVVIYWCYLTKKINIGHFHKIPFAPFTCSITTAIYTYSVIY